MWNRYTDKAFTVISHSREYAINFKTGYVSSEILLLAILRGPKDGVACTAGAGAPAGRGLSPPSLASHTGRRPSRPTAR